LRRGRGGLGVSDQGWEEEGGGGEEEDAGRMVRANGHHLKLYSECWTAFEGQGEN